MLIELPRRQQKNDSFMKRKIYISGAGGVVGTELKTKLAQKGFQVFPINRSGISGDYLLNDFDFSDGDLIIHAGIPFHPRTPKKRADYNSNSKALFKYANDKGIDLIFISSHSSREDNPSQYSRDKSYLEKLAMEQNCSVLRIGVFHSSQNAKQSLVVRAVNLFNLSFLKRLFDNLPVTQAQEIIESIEDITGSDHKIWNCYSFSHSSTGEKDSALIKIYNLKPTPTDVSEHGKRKTLLAFVNIINLLTHSFLDPIVNFASDLRYYAK